MGKQEQSIPPPNLGCPAPRVVRQARRLLSARPQEQRHWLLGLQDSGLAQDDGKTP
ncbi:MAG: hypothetical protein IKR81_02760 [Victivallales bacterium]|nr:hypothetical protein [Victivallales bacterium]